MKALNINISWPYLIGYAVIYLTLRLTNLTLLPTHYDEMAQLLRVATILEQGDIFIGLRDNLKWFQLLPIVALSWLFTTLNIELSPLQLVGLGRFTSALAGLAGAFGGYVLARELYPQKLVAVVVALLYLLLPAFVLYDRLIMPDSLLTALGLWAMVFSLWAIRHHSLSSALAAGLIISIASVTKLSGLVYLTVPVLTLLLFGLSAVPTPASIYGLVRAKMRPLLIMLGSGSLGLLLLLFSLNEQNLTVYGSKVADEGDSLTVVWWLNTQTALDWLTSLLTWPLSVLLLAGIVLAVWQRDRRGLYLLAIPALTLLSFIAIAETWYPRYLLTVVPPLLILSAWALLSILSRVADQLFKPSPEGRETSSPWQGASGTALYLIPTILLLLNVSLATHFYLLFDPPQVDLHPEQARQYISGWPNTYRLAEAGAYVNQLATQHPAINLATNENSFIVSEGLQYYARTWTCTGLSHNPAT